MPSGEERGYDVRVGIPNRGFWSGGWRSKSMPVLVLIDYHNLPAEWTRRGVAQLWTRLRASIGAEIGDKENDITLRLYGGWYDEKGLSRDGDQVAREMDSGFPILIRHPAGWSQRVHCEMASSLHMMRSCIFPATVRSRRGLKRTIKTKGNLACAYPDRCSIPSVMHWFKGRCPEQKCHVDSNVAFQRKEQKLVDTLMCCDLISISLESPTSPIFVVSEDDDFVPAMLMATHLGGNVCHVRTVAGRRGFYDEFLVQYGIRTITVSEPSKRGANGY